MGKTDLHYMKWYESHGLDRGNLLISHVLVEGDEG